MTEITLPEGYALEQADRGFALTARLRCPMSQARALAVVSASWVRDAIGGGAKILWPNHVVVDGKRVCAMECRARGDKIMLTFRPVDGAVPEDFERRVIRAAIAALEAYPENRSELLQRYCEHCLTVMKFVDTAYRGVPVYGFAFAVDKHGGLMVMTQESQTILTLYGGEAVIAEKREQEMPDLPRMPGR